MMDKPFANLRNLIAGEDEHLPRHGTPQPKQPENVVEASAAILAIHDHLMWETDDIPLGMIDDV